MNPFHKEARQAIIDYRAREQVGWIRIAEYYGIPAQVACACSGEGYDMGSLNARKVMRVELARRQEEKQGRHMTMPTAKDRYKGTRSV